jgi:hypothetical protein
MNYPSFFKSPDGREVVAFTGNDTVTTIRITEHKATGIRDIQMQSNRWENAVKGGILLSYTPITKDDFLIIGINAAVACMECINVEFEIIKL